MHPSQHEHVRVQLMPDSVLSPAVIPPTALLRGAKAARAAAAGGHNTIQARVSGGQTG